MSFKELENTIVSVAQKKTQNATVDAGFNAEPPATHTYTHLKRREKEKGILIRGKEAVEKDKLHCSLLKIKLRREPLRSFSSSHSLEGVH